MFRLFGLLVIFAGIVIAYDHYDKQQKATKGSV